MRHSTLLASTLAALGTLAACAGEPTGVVTHDPFALVGVTATAPATVSSECGGRTDRPDSRAILTWADPGTSGIASDGGSYTGGQQGVQAKVFYYDQNCSRSGDLVFDPDLNSASPARKLVLRFPTNGIGLPTGGVTSGAAMNFPAIMQLGSDVNWDILKPTGRDARIEAKISGGARSLEYPAFTALRPTYPAGAIATSNFRLNNIGVAGCEQLEYASIQLTRTVGQFDQLIGQYAASDASPLGQWSTTVAGAWTVSSVSPHAVQCYVTKKGQLVTNGATMSMPFSVTISEIVTP